MSPAGSATALVLCADLCLANNKSDMAVANITFQHLVFSHLSLSLFSRYEHWTTFSVSKVHVHRRKGAVSFISCSSQSHHLEYTRDFPGWSLLALKMQAHCLVSPSILVLYGLCWKIMTNLLILVDGAQNLGQKAFRPRDDFRIKSLIRALRFLSRYLGLKISFTILNPKNFAYQSVNLKQFSTMRFSQSIIWFSALLSSASAAALPDNNEFSRSEVTPLRSTLDTRSPESNIQCQPGGKVCEGGCIPESDICCVGGGGCPVGSNCVGEWGCCPKGRLCR